jgi:hypothetical protein
VKVASDRGRFTLEKLITRPGFVKPIRNDIFAVLVSTPQQCMQCPGFMARPANGLTWLQTSLHSRRQVMYCEFKVCKSVHHHAIQINHQLDATVSSVCYLDFCLQLNMFRASSRHH